jgi:hypothetical protein
MKIGTAVNLAADIARGALKTDITLDIPAKAPPASGPLVDRIRASFAAMKACDPRWSGAGPEWQAQLDAAFPLKERFGEFLANFGIWPTYTGIEEAGYQMTRLNHWAGRKYIEEAYFRRPLRAWAAYGRPLSALAFPRHGNQAGAIYQGAFISPGPTNDLLGLQVARLAGGGRPVLAEIGAGYGKLAWCALRDMERFCYLDFDLPETLCTAAYYLGLAFPEKRMLLFGEREFSAFCLDDYDLIFMPGWEVAKLAVRSVDVFFNKNSLGEMTAATATTYLDHIARATRGYFFHLNHDAIRCGHGMLAHEYPVDMRLLLREPDIGHLAVGGSADIFQYLYCAHFHTGIQ